MNVETQTALQDNEDKSTNKTRTELDREWNLKNSEVDLDKVSFATAINLKVKDLFRYKKKV